MEFCACGTEDDGCYFTYFPDRSFRKRRIQMIDDKSHKCHIWCRLHGNTRCNQPLELDRSWTEVTLIGAMALVRSSSECADGSQTPTLRLTAD